MCGRVHDTLTWHSAFRFFQARPLIDKSVLVFGVQMAEGEEERILVKFPTSYGTDVHRSLAAAGLAPQLYAVTELPGGFLQVCAFTSSEALIDFLSHPQIASSRHMLNGFVFMQESILFSNFLCWRRLKWSSCRQRTDGCRWKRSMPRSWRQWSLHCWIRCGVCMD